MTPDTTLRCRCGQEVRIVRLNAKLLGLGHVSNPRDGHHAVQLSRSGVGTSARGQEDSRRQTEGPEVPAVASRQRTNATRSASDGRSRTARPSGIRSKSPEQGRSQQDPSPAPASAQGLGPR